MILLAYGTRPEYIKVRPLIDVLMKNNFPFRTLFIAQHLDLLYDEADYSILVADGDNRLDSIISSVLNKVPLSFITHVLVQGDTTAAFAVALSSHHHGMKVVHLEAGLRTYDNKNPWPEEQNRRMISQLSDIHLCPTLKNADNLDDEKVSGEVYVTGNTAIDNLVGLESLCEYQDKVLITLHRRENHVIMDEWFGVINELAASYPDTEFIFPLHPNPAVQKHKLLLSNVCVVDPMSHDSLLRLLVKVKLVITDSGGLQEECSYLNKRCLVCRKTTERPEAVGLSSIMVTSPQDLRGVFEKYILDYAIDYPCPFGDGFTAKKIYKIMTTW